MPSHVIRSFDYDPETRSLDILFVAGRRYRYTEVPPHVAEAMKAAFAKGGFFNAHIRDRYPATRLDEPEPDLFSVRKVRE
jgi:hypothetical protein